MFFYDIVLHVTLRPATQEILIDLKCSNGLSKYYMYKQKIYYKIKN